MLTSIYRWLLVLAVGCGNSSSPPPAPAPTQVHVAPRSPVLDRTADHFAALADAVADTAALTNLRDAIATIHQSATYKKALARSPYKPLDLARIEQTIQRRGELARSLQQSAKSLRGNQVLPAIEPLADAINQFFRDAVSSSDIVDELVWLRDNTKSDLTALSHAFDEAQTIGSAVRSTFDTATSDLAALPLDTHTRVVLQRVSDRGPAFGEPCGPEDLCGSGNRCVARTHTCELECQFGAMQECPGGRACANGLCR